jgi:metallophosphoesterase superfamily enzyme
MIIQALTNGKGNAKEAYALYANKEIKQAYPNIITFKRHVRRLRTKLYPNYIFSNIKDAMEVLTGKATFTEDPEGATVEVIDSERIKTLDQLLEECQVDLEVWKVDNYTVNKWEQASKNESGDITITPLFQIKARLARIQPLVPVIQPITFDKKYKADYDVTRINERVLIIADAQIGFNNHLNGEIETFHDVRAMNIILAILDKNHYETIIINGDMLDMTEASRYVQKPEFSRTLQPAINCLGQFLESIRKRAPKSKIVYLAGNHEIRLQNQIIENMKFAYGLTAYKQNIPLMSLRNILALDELDIEYIEDYPKGTYWIGDNLRIIHGEFTSITKELNTSHTNVIMGHLHRIETQSKTTFAKTGPQQVSVHGMGCLCKIDGTVPGVTARPNWQQGIMDVSVTEDFVGINHIQIVNGTCVYNGRTYNGWYSKE